ncbi:hypothetical protein ACHWQZ_G010070 [Mnemiopsis leidyi]
MADLSNFVMQEADRQSSSQENVIDSDKMQNFYNSALSSIKQLKELLVVAFHRHHNEQFAKGLLYSDVMNLLNSGPPLTAKSIVGLIHYGPTTSYTVINVLNIIKQNCIYVPISIENEMKLQMCNKIIIDVQEYETKTKNPPKNKRKRLGDTCCTCLEIIRSHCNQCASWVQLASKIESCHIDYCMIDETAIKYMPFLIPYTTRLVTIKLKNPACTCMCLGMRKPFDVVNHDIAYIFTTSGTTGQPKSVHVPNSSIIPNILFFHEKLQIATEDKVLSCSPLTFDPSIIEIFLTVLAGASFVFVDSAVSRISCNQLSDVSVLMCTPSFVTTLPQSTRKQILCGTSKIRILALGGEMFPLCFLDDVFSSKHLNNSDVKIFNFYGITEQSCWSFIYEFRSKDIDLQHVPLGELVPGTRYCIKNEELFLSGDRKCYIDEKLAPEWYATGDRVFAHRGKLYIAGRINKDQVKINGKKLCRLLIQRTIRKHFNINSHVKFSSGKVYLFLFTDTDLSEYSVRHELSKILPSHYKFDRIIMSSKAIPLTSHHKIDENKLVCKHVSLQLTKTNLDNTVNEFLNLRGVMSFKMCRILVNMGLDSLDIMQMSTYLLDTFPCLSLSNDADSLYQILCICPLNKLWETITTEQNSSNTPTPLKDKQSSLKIISRSNLTLCVDSSPAVFTNSDGKTRYCVGSHAGVLYCGSLPESTEVWRCELPDRIESSPCTLLSYVVVGCYDGCIYVVGSETGDIVYTVHTTDQVKCSPTSDDDSVYCGSHDGRLYKVTSRFEAGVTHFSSKSVKVDDKPISASVLALSTVLVVCTLSGKVAALNKTLDTLFSTQFKAPIFSSPICSRDETVIFTALVTGEVYKLSAKDLAVVQKINADGLIYSNPLLHDNVLYLTTHKEMLHCYSDTFTKQWSCSTSGKVSSSPAIVGDAAIVFASTVGTVSVRSLKDGSSLGCLTLPGQSFSSPTVCQIGSAVYMVIGCRDNFCYVLGLNI